jgi:rhomboid protease GluP
VSESTSADGPGDETGQLHPQNRDSISLLKKIPTTFGLIGVTVLVFIGQVVVTNLTGRDLVAQFGMKENGAIAAGEIWRLITPVFVHAGIPHIFVNMYSLYALGPAVERIFGSQRMLVIYLLSGISGVILSFGFSPHASVGASGAIFGLLGALGTFIYRHRDRLGPVGRLQLRQIVMVTLLNLGLGLLPMVDNWGHLGGLLAGIALTWVLGPQLEVSISEGQRPIFRDRRPWHKVRWLALPAVTLLVLLAFVASLSPYSR